jgi:hypothetical protein
MKDDDKKSFNIADVVNVADEILPKLSVVSFEIFAMGVNYDIYALLQHCLKFCKEDSEKEEKDETTKFEEMEKFTHTFFKIAKGSDISIGSKFKIGRVESKADEENKPNGVLH